MFWFRRGGSALAARSPAVAGRSACVDSKPTALVEGSRPAVNSTAADGTLEITEVTIP